MHMNDAPELTQPTRPTQAGRPGGVWHWTTRELLVAATIGALGAALTAATKAAATALYAISPVLAAPMTGTALFVGVLAASLIRRPGAALVAGAVVAIVVTPFGGFNPRNLVAAAVVAIAVELAALVSRYRMLTWYGVLLAALLNGAFLLSIHWLVWRMSQMVPALQIGTAVSLVGAQIVWAALGVVVARMLARAGVHVSTSR